VSLNKENDNTFFPFMPKILDFWINEVNQDDRQHHGPIVNHNDYCENL
jgi:hypothetical protein